MHELDFDEVFNQALKDGAQVWGTKYTGFYLIPCKDFDLNACKQLHKTLSDIAKTYGRKLDIKIFERKNK